MEYAGYLAGGSGTVELEIVRPLRVGGAGDRGLGWQRGDINLDPDSSETEMD